VSENRELRIVYRHKRDQVIANWRKFHNQELHSVYSSPNMVRMIKSRRIIYVGHVARTGDKTRAYKVLVGKPEEERPLGKLIRNR
jgi:hypothetical protein